jgi:hypothetical protein
MTAHHHYPSPWALTLLLMVLSFAYLAGVAIGLTLRYGAHITYLTP